MAGPGHREPHRDRTGRGSRYPRPRLAHPAGAPADPAALVLDRAALLTAARRGGRQPGRAEPGIADEHGIAGERGAAGKAGGAAEPETAPVVSRAAGLRLAAILGGQHADLLPEWLAAAAGRGRRVPAGLLPALLHQGRRGSPAGPGLRRLIAAAGGSRARWLAGLNPEWAFILAYAPAGEDAWRLGDAAQRRGYLSALRARDPGAARDLVAASWDTAGPDERVMFLNALSDGLSLADESLLEGALDDRHAWVRKAAAGLLAALPGSALARRMAGRARECLYLEPGMAGPRLVVSPPGEYGADMRRDGITPGEGASAASAASRGGLLLEVMARTPLRTWTDGFAMQPAGILALPAGGWKPVLFTAWSRAAMTQHDQEWLVPLTNLALTGAAGDAGTLRLLARHVDPALIAPGPGAGVAGPVGAAIRETLDTLRFRYQMLRELTDDDGAG